MNIIFNIIDKEIKLEDKNKKKSEIEKKKKERQKKNNLFDNFFSKDDDDIIMEELFKNHSNYSNQNNFPIIMNQINSDKSIKFSKINSSPPIKKSIGNNKKSENKKDIIDLNLTKKEKAKAEPESKDIILGNKKLSTKKTKQLKRVENYILIKERFKEILAYIDVELNELGYKKAFKFDHRTYWLYYFSLLKTKHIFFQIFDKKDYNSISIKILLLFFNFAANYAVNALFFSDETMHQISEDGGDFNIIYQLPQIVYSTINSMIIDYATSSLSLSQEDVVDIKKHKNLKTLDEKAMRIKKSIRIKTILFFVTNFLFILLFWYYLECFCAVYKNTQYHLIKDTLISYGIGIVTPFATFFIPGIFRIPALKKFTPRNKKLYKFSKLFQKYL